MIRRMLYGLMVVACLVLLYGCPPIQIPPPPKPPPPTTPTPPPPECMPGVPWCHEAGQTCSSEAKPCKHNPSADPAHCELAPACPKPPDPPPPPDPPAPPVPSNCDGEPGPIIRDRRPELGASINAALAAVTGCAPGSRCVVRERPQEFQRRVIERLRADGLCAGQHEPGITDEIAVATSTTAPREGWHIYAGAWDDPAGTGTVVWSPGAARPAYAAPAGPPPQGPPPPPPSTPPPAGACGAPVPPPLGKIAAKVHTTGPAWTVLDSTPLVGPDIAFCASIGYTDGRQFCPVRPEGPEHVAARRCWEDERTGGIEWRGTGGEALPDGNPYGWRIPRRTFGTWQACSRRSPVICSKPVAVEP